MTDDYKILNWFLQCEPVGMALNWPVQTEQLVDSIKRIHLLSKSDAPDPQDIAAAWTDFSGAVGPALTLQIMGSNEWRQFVPSVEGYGDDWCNVWAAGFKRVVARVVMRDGVPVNVSYGVE